MTRTHSLRLVLLLCALAALVAVGCGSDSKDEKTTGTAGTTSKINVPKDIKAKGTLTVAADASYPPNEFIGPDGKTVMGMSVDLADALGAELGLKVNVKNAGFDSIIPGLAANKYDLGFSSFTDTKEREQTVDFVTYFTAGTSFYVKTDGGPDITGLDDLCGMKVAVEKGTTQADDATKQSKKCEADGKGAVTVLTFPDQNGANLALSSGRADVGMSDSPVTAYQVKKSDGQFKLIGEAYGTAPYGIALSKDSGLAQPMLEAMKAIIKSGKYLEILKKWGVEDGAIDTPVINGAQS